MYLCRWSVHRRLCAVRRRRLDYHACPLSSPAGLRRRHDHARSVSDHGSGCRAKAHGSRDGDSSDAGHDGADPWPGDRRRILEYLHWSGSSSSTSRSEWSPLRWAWRMLPHTDSGHAGRLDALGLVLMSGASSTLVYGLSELGTVGTSLGCSTGRRADRCRRRAGGPLLLARSPCRAACSTSACTPTGSSRPPPSDHVRPRCRPVRRDDPGTLLHQEVRHESVIVTAFLTGPQGIGTLLGRRSQGASATASAADGWRWPACRSGRSPRSRSRSSVPVRRLSISPWCLCSAGSASASRSCRP